MERRISAQHKIETEEELLAGNDTAELGHPKAVVRYHLQYLAAIKDLASSTWFLVTVI